MSSPDDLTISICGIQSPKQLFVERWGFLFGVFYIPPSLSSAQKLVSLCGWEPRALPYVVDCKDRSTQLVKDSDVRDSYHMVINGQNPSIRFHYVASEQSVEANEESGSCSGRHADPNAVVLDCKLCGARQVSANENHAGSRGVIGDSASNGALSSMLRPSDLSMTIVGGPLPTKQNFKATISLPVIGPNLRARLSYDSDFRDRICDNQEITRSGSENNNLTSEERESAEQNFGEVSMKLWRSESNSSEMIISSINHDGQQIPGADISGSKNVACQIDMRKSQTCSDIQNTIGAQEKGHGTTGGVQVPVNSEVVAYSTGKDPKQLALDKTLGFNPNRQRRHFCTWIVSTSSGPPGWQQTLSALERQKEFSLPSTNSPPSSSLIKVDDPIASVRKLFMPTSGSS
ncbi:hypothetical protein Peur_034690 [Populus x canadensis]